MKFFFIRVNGLFFRFLGVPKDLRAEVWRFLLEQHNLDRSRRSQLDIAPNYRYRTLLKDLTSYQHAILIDLGEHYFF